MMRVNDNVVMLQGKDRGKKGKVLMVLLSGTGAMRVVVEGLNTIKRHQKARKQGQKGQIVIKERAVDASNVSIVCSKCGKQTRIGYVKEGKNKKRVCKKCNAKF